MSPSRTLYFFFLFAVATLDRAAAQPVHVIPAFTGYAIPLEKSGENDESDLFSPTEGLHNWDNKNQQIHFFFYLRHPGPLSVSVMIKNASAGNTVKLRLAGQLFAIQVPKSDKFEKIRVGSVQIVDTGFYDLELFCTRKMGKTIASLESVELAGSAAEGAGYNMRARRNAASVHLSYPLPDTSRTIAFYNDVTVPVNTDQLYSYFMACGFARGYFGMQVNSATERRIIFSVWDAGGEPVDRSKVNVQDQVKLLAKGTGVVTEGFGNEGTGGHSHFVYAWKPGLTYRFYVTCLPDTASGSTIYTGYFFVPEQQAWKLIACFRAPRDGRYLNHLYSFVENFRGVNGNLYRQANFSNSWARTDIGDWRELTDAVFSCDATGKALDRMDYGGGVENNTFYLWNGGFQKKNTQAGLALKRQATGQRPVIDLYKNADSSAQAAKDKKDILDFIAAGKFDTTGSINGVYYQIVKQGEGDLISLQDTLTVNYKGWVMGGEVFDETKDRPATFALNRLIKGWQVSLTRCKNGGRIRAIIPSGLAYSMRARSEKIPPNSILVFDIEVLQDTR